MVLFRNEEQKVSKIIKLEIPKIENLQSRNLKH